MANSLNGLYSALVDHALAARENAYCEYSGFAVGAALLCADGTVYSGCNIENASYPATNCAERTAIFRAVSDGKRKFAAIAVVGGKKGQAPNDFCPPCGVCRQVMAEFCSADFAVLLYNGSEIKKLTLGELLPHSFGAENL